MAELLSRPPETTGADAKVDAASLFRGRSRLTPLAASLLAFHWRNLWLLPLGLGVYLLTLPILVTGVRLIDGLTLPSYQLLAFIGLCVYGWGTGTAVAAHQLELLGRETAPLLIRQRLYARVASGIWLLLAGVLPFPVLWATYLRTDPDLLQLPASAGLLAGVSSVALGTVMVVLVARGLFLLLLGMMFVPLGLIPVLKGLEGGTSLAILIALGVLSITILLPPAAGRNRPLLDTEEPLESFLPHGSLERRLLPIVLTTHASSLEALTVRGRKASSALISDVRLLLLGMPALRAYVHLLFGAGLFYLIFKTTSAQSTFSASPLEREKLLVFLVAAAALVNAHLSAHIALLEETRWLGLLSLRRAPWRRFVAGSLCAFTWRGVGAVTLGVVLPLLILIALSGSTDPGFALLSTVLAVAPTTLAVSRLEALNAHGATGLIRLGHSLAYAILLVLSGTLLIEAPSLPWMLLPGWGLAGVGFWAIAIRRFLRLEPA